MIVTFIGGGNMASALIGGMLNKGFQANGIRVVELVAEARERMRKDFGVDCHESPASAVPGSDVVVLAVKPQQLQSVARAIGPLIRGALVLSIAAGIRLADIERWLVGSPVLARCMPNTPALIGMGISALYARPNASAAQREAAARILGAGGKVVWVDDESLLDPVTALSGSGPAYAFYLLEAMQEAGVAMGLAPGIARELAIETVRGAAELAARASESPERLRAKVTSKGGTTEAALASMESAGVKRAIVRAIGDANRRAAELAEQFGKDT